MPRNASGLYTLVAGNPVIADTLIESGWANTSLADIAQAITDSLDRNGRGGMVGSFKVADGTAAGPGLAFAAESSTGLYREAPKVFSLAVNGVKVVGFESDEMTVVQPTTMTDLTVTGATTFTTTLPQSDVVPSDYKDLVNKAYVEYALSTGAPGGGFLPLSAGASVPLTGDLYITNTPWPTVYFEDPGRPANNGRAHINITSDNEGRFGLYVTDDTGATIQGGIQIARDGYVYDAKSNYRFLTGNDLGPGKNLNADMVDGYHANIALTPNQIVVRDGNGDTFSRNVNASGQVIVSNIALSNASGALSVNANVNSSGNFSAAFDVVANRDLRATNGWVYSTGGVIQGNLKCTGVLWGGPIQNESATLQCTASPGNTHQLAFFWDNQYVAVNIDGTLKKGFDTWNYCDERIKRNVQPATVDALATLRALNVMSADVDPDLASLMGLPRHERMAIVAQHLQQVIPEAVGHLSDSGEMDERIPKDLLAVHYKQLVPWLVKAVQQLADRLDEVQYA